MYSKPVCSDYTLLGIEPDWKEDTYTLIPNGKWIMIPSDGVVNHYLVQHDRSGETISWRGPSRENYYDHGLDVDYNNFETFYDWSDNDRKKWKTQELVRIKQQHPYYDPDVNELVKAYDEVFKKENNMHYNTATAAIVTTQSESAKQRQYLEDRLYNVVDKKCDELRTFFKIDPVEAPDTLRKAIEMLKSGDFTADDDLLDKKTYYLPDLFYRLRWTKDKADQAGYEAALKKLYVARTKVMDSISILDPKEGLAALEAFEAQTFR